MGTTLLAWASPRGSHWRCSVATGSNTNPCTHNDQLMTGDSLPGVPPRWRQNTQPPSGAGAHLSAIYLTPVQFLCRRIDKTPAFHRS
jgi:hypothetical protein